MKYLPKIVIDTNIIFMALYKKESKPGILLYKAIENKINLFSPISVKKELIRILKRKLNWDDNKIDFVINSLPINWIEKEVYEFEIKNTTVKHKPDKPVEALAIVLNYPLVSADSDFDNVKNKIDIEEKNSNSFLSWSNTMPSRTAI